LLSRNKNLSLATGTISQKIVRGKHTTGHVEIFKIEDTEDSGYLADTPGFSLIDFERLDFFELDDLLPAFPELIPYAGGCRYSDCAHYGESADECAVARAVERGKIPKTRHDSYKAIYKVLKGKNKYD
jgi:ribosome biogenesis GTPase